MEFLRGIFGRGRERADDDAPADLDERAGASPQSDLEERQHELDVLRAEAERLDELTQRQLKYSAYSWQPPDQGGERRSDDGEGSSGS